MVKGKDSRLLKTDRSSHDDSVERTISAKRAGSSMLWSDRCSTMWKSQVFYIAVTRMQNHRQIFVNMNHCEVACAASELNTGV